MSLAGRLILVLASVLLAACGTAGRRKMASFTELPPKVEPGDRDAENEGAREDSPQEAAEFYLLKRTGGLAIPMDRLFEAERHARRMPLYSLAGRRFIAR